MQCCIGRSESSCRVCSSAGAASRTPLRDDSEGEIVFCVCTRGSLTCARARVCKSVGTSVRASERLSLFQRKGLAGLFFLFFFGRSLALLS